MNVVLITFLLESKALEKNLLGLWQFEESLTSTSKISDKLEYIPNFNSIFCS